MNTVIGTACFVSLSAALSYYRAYGYGKPEVALKLAQGEISIGPPAEGKIAYVNEGRYFIEV